jgi:hypothetical protein
MALLKVGDQFLRLILARYAKSAVLLAVKQLVLGADFEFEQQESPEESPL